MSERPACALCFKSSTTPMCHECRTKFVDELFAVAELFDDLDITITRTDKMGGIQLGTTTNGNSTPLPFNLRASNARSNLTSVLRRHGIYAALRRPDVEGHRSYVGGWARDLARSENAPTIRQTIMHAIGRARRAIDRPVQREWLGPCDCSTDLYAAPGETTIECLQCERVHNVDVYRRRVLRAAGNHFEGTATELAAMMSRFGYKVAPGTITQWGVRGQIAASGTRRGKPSYRLDHVIERVRRSGQRDELEPYRALARALS